MFKYILITFILLFETASAVIIQTDSYADIEAEIDRKTLVFVDLDLTTITSSRTLGSQPWWDHMQKVWADSGMDTKVVMDYFAPIIRQVFEHVPAMAVEPSIPTVIRNLQEKGVTVLALTARSKKSPWDIQHDETTAGQLRQLGIDFTKSPLPEGGTLDAHYPQFVHGILFTNWQNKAPFLMEFLALLNCSPSKIIVIDDSIDQLKSIEVKLLEAGIPFVGFYYTKLKDQQIDPAIGNIQLQFLHQESIILTDEEALRIKLENPDRSPDFYLEELLLQLKQQSGMLTPH